MTTGSTETRPLLGPIWTPFWGHPMMNPTQTHPNHPRRVPNDPKSICSHHKIIFSKNFKPTPNHPQTPRKRCLRTRKSQNRYALKPTPVSRRGCGGSPGWVGVGHGAKHSPSTRPQGGPSGTFGGSSCEAFFSTSTQCFPCQNLLQKQKLLCIKGFKP